MKDIYIEKGLIKKEIGETVYLFYMSYKDIFMSKNNVLISLKTDEVFYKTMLTYSNILSIKIKTDVINNQIKLNFIIEYFECNGMIDQDNIQFKKEYCSVDKNIEQLEKSRKTISNFMNFCNDNAFPFSVSVE